eukprot:1394905-Amorphochlora_amoeboformis.AAC.2
MRYPVRHSAKHSLALLYFRINLSNPPSRTLVYPLRDRQHPMTFYGCKNWLKGAPLDEDAMHRVLGTSLMLSSGGTRAVSENKTSAS